MGLDMYAFSLKADLSHIDNTVDLSEVFPDQKAAIASGHFNTEFAYWRKFNNLHGWMEKLYRERGGNEVFNCVSIRLRKEDLDQLAQEARTLDPVSGLFFGHQSPMSEDDVAEVIDFVVRAKFEIDSGREVLYSSWW